MLSQVVADDRVVESFAAVEPSGILSQRLLATQRSLPTVVGVIVRVDRRIFAQEHEFIGMAAIAEIKLHVFSEILLQAHEPGSGEFPGVKVSIELIGAKWLVAVTHQEQRPPEPGLNAGIGESWHASVVPVGHESAGKIARRAELLVPPSG